MSPSRARTARSAVGRSEGPGGAPEPTEAPEGPKNATGGHSARAFAYLRVSTSDQDVAAQKLGILEYAKRHNLPPLRFVEETASGTIGAGARDFGKILLPQLQTGDLLVVSEISRLGRRLVDILTTLRSLGEIGVHVHVVKQDMRLDQTLNSKILTTVLGLAAEIERELISQRTREGQAKARAKGRHIGRPRVTEETMRRSKLDAKADEIRRYAASGVNKANIARIVDCNWLTLHQWMARHRISVSRPSAR